MEMAQRYSNPQAVAAENARFMSGVYKWMTIGLLITSLFAYYAASSTEFMAFLMMNKLAFYGLMIAEFGLVIYLSSAINKLSASTATFLYILYASLTGLTFSVIFLAYTQESIVGAFLMTSCGFAGLSLFGYTTKKDLGPIGAFCGMAVWGLVAFAVISMFFPSMMGGQMGSIYSIAGILIFSGLTAYDTQKIKAMNIIGNEGTEEDKKETIMGALKLYLDFINLFLMVLRLMGGRRK